MKKTLLLGVTAGAMVMFNGCVNQMNDITPKIKYNTKSYIHFIDIASSPAGYNKTVIEVNKTSLKLIGILQRNKDLIYEINPGEHIFYLSIPERVNNFVPLMYLAGGMVMFSYGHGNLVKLNAQKGKDYYILISKRNIIKLTPQMYKYIKTLKGPCDKKHLKLLFLKTNNSDNKIVNTNYLEPDVNIISISSIKYPFILGECRDDNIKYITFAWSVNNIYGNNIDNILNTPQIEANTDTYNHYYKYKKDYYSDIAYLKDKNVSLKIFPNDGFNFK